MAISEHRIYRQLVQVEWTDTVRAVCDKVGGRYPDRPLQTYIWLRHPLGGYAVAAMYDLDQRAWTIGHDILPMPLSRFPDLFPPQPGVQRDGPLGDYQAGQEARRYAGRLLVLKGDRVVGCVLNETRGGDSRPTGAFRLFDPPIPLEELERAPVVVARYDTTVAAALAQSDALRTDELPYILFADPYRDGRWFVFAADELRKAVAQDTRAQGWPLAQLSTVSYKECRSVAYEAVGQAQAEELRAQEGCLVVLYRGRPRLIVSGITLRGETRLSWFDRAADLEMLPGPDVSAVKGVSPTAPVQPGGRYVNLWFEGEEAQEPESWGPYRAYPAAYAPLPPAPGPERAPLTLGRVYRLCVNVGRHLAKSIVDWEEEVRPPPIVEPPEVAAKEEARLYVSLFSADFDIEEPTQVLTLPPRGDSEPIRFEVRPVRRTFGEADLATLEVCLYYRCNLVQSFQVQAEALPQGEKARTARPQRARLQAARVRDYPDLDQIASKEMNLTITKRADGAYQFTFTLTPEAVEDPQWDEIRLGCRVNLTRDELTHLITKARRQLYNITRSPAYQRDVTVDPGTQRKALGALALLGRQLYSRLFEQGGPHSAARQVAAWIEEHLDEGSTLQVVDRARDFVFPWSLVYDRTPWDEGGLAEKVDLAGFWGYRYQIELLTDDLLQTYQAQGAEIDAPEGLRVGVGVNAKIPWSREQGEFWDRMRTQSGDKAAYCSLESSLDLTKFLQKGDQHIFYVFCHGFTERMAADIQIGDDLLGGFRAWLRALPEEQRQALKDQADSLFNVSDSWIKLTYGTVPLTMMEHYAVPRLADAPFVFLNMCESAQVLPSLSGGFIPFFLRRGARGIVGTECPMTSTFAHSFAVSFFQRLLQGQRVGRILWELRREFLAKGNPLGLAYTLYCDANVKLKEAILEP